MKKIEISHYGVTIREVIGPLLSIKEDELSFIRLKTIHQIREGLILESDSVTLNLIGQFFKVVAVAENTDLKKGQIITSFDLKKILESYSKAK